MEDTLTGTNGEFICIELELLSFLCYGTSTCTYITIQCLMSLL
jgi:hypothetical protein